MLPRPHNPAALTIGIGLSLFVGCDRLVDPLKLVHQVEKPHFGDVTTCPNPTPAASCYLSQADCSLSIECTRQGLFKVALHVNATASRPGPLTYRWEFGDGTPADERPNRTDYTYAKRDNYLLRVTATDEDGAQESVVARVTVKGNNQRPIAHIGVVPTTRIACVDDAVILDASQSFDPDNDDFVKDHSWTIVGPGLNEPTMRDEKKTSVTLKAGKYFVTLVVRDKFGDESQADNTSICIEPKDTCSSTQACVG